MAGAGERESERANIHTSVFIQLEEKEKVEMDNVRVISNLVPGDIPIRDEREIGIADLSEIGHLGRASVRVLSVRDEVVDRADGVRLDGVVSGMPVEKQIAFERDRVVESTSVGE